MFNKDNKISDLSELPRKFKQRTRRLFTVDEIKQVKALHACGMSNKNIGAKVGRHEASINSKLIHLGLKPILSKSPRISKEEQAKIRFYYNQGFNVREIADKLGRSAAGVNKFTSKFRRFKSKQSVGGGNTKPVTALRPTRTVIMASDELYIADLVTTQKVLNALGYKLTLVKLNN